ncbi:MAG: replication initiation protein [Thermoplasmatales archaeon]
MHYKDRISKSVFDIDDNNYVVFANSLIEARYKMSLNESKIYIAIISLIGKDDQDIKAYEVEAKSLKNILNSDDFNIYDDVKQTVRKLASRIIEIEKKETKDWRAIPIWSELRYKNGILYAEFSEKIKPYLYFLKKDFTSFLLKEYKSFTSKYSIRIYQFLKQYQKIGERIFDIEDLRLKIGIEKGKLENFAYFRRRVIEVAQKELENTPLAFTWEVTKKSKGGKVVEIKFILKHKQVALTKEETLQDLQQAQQKSQVSDKNESFQNTIIGLLEQLPQERRTHAAEMLLASYLQTYGADYIKRQIEYVNKQKPNNYFAYLKKAIEKDYANSQIAELEKARQQKMLEKALQDLEAERQHSIEVAVDREKSLIYSEYLSLLDDKEKEEFLKKYLEKAKELYPNVKEDSFEMEFKVECLAVEDIIAGNNIYQIRLSKVRERAEKQAQAEFEQSKQSLYMKLQNN